MRTNDLIKAVKGLHSPHVALYLVCHFHSLRFLLFSSWNANSTHISDGETERDKLLSPRLTRHPITFSPPLIAWPARPFCGGVLKPKPEWPALRQLALLPHRTTWATCPLSVASIIPKSPHNLRSGEAPVREAGCFADTRPMPACVRRKRQEARFLQLNCVS